MAGHAWSIDGKQAGVQALREALALERQSRKKRSVLEYERQAAERNSRKVGAAIRKQARETRRTVCSLSTRTAIEVIVLASTKPGSFVNGVGLMMAGAVQCAPCG